MSDLRNIETFYWVAILGGFRSATERLHTTQPSISQRIHSLEESLGVRLFDRDNHRTTLTRKGVELLPIAEQLLRTHSNLKRIARQENIINGRLRLGVSETLVHTWLPHLMTYLYQNHPLLVIDIQVNTSAILKDKINSHQIDLAFLLGPMTEPNVQNIDLCEYPLQWFSSPQLFNGDRPISLKHVASLPVITYSATTDPFKEVQRRLISVGADPIRIYGSDTLSVILNMAENRIGIAVVALITAQRKLEDGTLIALQIDGPPLPPLRYTASWPIGPGDMLQRIVAQAAKQLASVAEI